MGIFFFCFVALLSAVDVVVLLLRSDCKTKDFDQLNTCMFVYILEEYT